MTEGLTRSPVPADPEAAAGAVRDALGRPADLCCRELSLPDGTRAAVMYLDGLVDAQRLEMAVIRYLLDPPDAAAQGGSPAGWLPSAALRPVQNLGELVTAVLEGCAGLVMAGRGAWAADIRGYERRAIQEPPAENVIRGPREGFTEDLRTNTALLRRRIRHPGLRICEWSLGKRTRTRVALVYLEGVASPLLVREARRRIQAIETDAVLSAGVLEEWVEDHPYSPFPQLQYTERPDTVVGSLLEGRIAMMVNGEPVALIAPVTFWGLLHHGEDYYERYMIAGALRLLRWISLAVSLLGPAMYVAISTFHQEMIPTALLSTLQAAREAIPFPAVVEAFIMEVIFEVLREAGVRLPRAVGQAVSIVGALVIGEAAVRAGFASAPVVIVVAGTGIASFTVPRFSLGIAFRLLRFLMLGLGGVLGLYGVMLGIIAVTIHLCDLSSFGVPYMRPVAPVAWADWRDFLVRLPHWLLRRRPHIYRSVNPVRQAEGPRPPRAGRLR